MTWEQGNAAVWHQFLAETHQQACASLNNLHHSGEVAHFADTTNNYKLCFMSNKVGEDYIRQNYV